MSLWSLIKSHPQRSIKTLSILTGCLMHGLHMGATGPALLDLGQQVSADLTAISLIMTAETAGFLIATVLSQ